MHTGSVYSHKVACMRLPEGPQRQEDWDHGPAEGQDPTEWFRERLAELTDELSSRGPQAAAYTWYEDDQTVGFWFRRMAQETAVHRADVESGFDAVTAGGRRARGRRHRRGARLVPALPERRRRRGRHPAAARSRSGPATTSGGRP